mgnify:FL=1
MNQQFLIPANSKKSMLIFGLFETFDLLLVGIGVSMSFLLFLILPTEEMIYLILTLAPGMITIFLVLPVPYYHNVRTFIRIVYNYFTTRQKFIWKGWCYLDDEEYKIEDSSKK